MSAITIAIVGMGGGVGASCRPLIAIPTSSSSHLLHIIAGVVKRGGGGEAQALSLSVPSLVFAFFVLLPSSLFVLIIIRSTSFIHLLSSSLSILAELWLIHIPLSSFSSSFHLLFFASLLSPPLSFLFFSARFRCSVLHPHTSSFVDINLHFLVPFIYCVCHGQRFSGFLLSVAVLYKQGNFFFPRCMAPFSARFSCLCAFSLPFISCRLKHCPVRRVRKGVQCVCYVIICCL
mmetsp:Transcript_34300/g.88657  ORF Transcript_34300/g.88657 Transcript_34300/m.88657 type:complete len:233 (-) Transcript_34300:1210-1908(-)